MIGDFSIRRKDEFYFEVERLLASLEADTQMEGLVANTFSRLKNQSIQARV
ncbi:hypothetical protein ACS0TY_021199 [Phlomoides rotata]